MHHIVLPIAEVESVVVPHEEPSSVEHVVVPLANVPVSVRPAVLALAVLARILVEALVLAAVVPLLLAEAMLLVLVPVPHVFGPVGMPVDAETLGHVVHELSFVEVTARVVQLASAVVEIVLPEAFVDRPVWPSHDSVSVLDVMGILEHLTRVDRALLAVLVDPHGVDVRQGARLQVLELLLDYLVAVVQSLPRRVASEVRLDLNYLLLVT